MIQLGDEGGMAGGSGGHHSQEVIDAHDDWDPDAAEGGAEDEGWTPPIVETVATKGEGVEAFIEALADHQRYLVESGTRAGMTRQRYAEEIRTLLREDVHAMLEDRLAAAGGVDELAEAVREGETDPYSIADDLLAPVEECVDELRLEDSE